MHAICFSLTDFIHDGTILRHLHRDGKARILSGMKRMWVVAILFLAFWGVADSAYIAQNEINGTPLLCDIQGISGCNIVANSQYAYLFDIPLAEYGVLFYGIIFVLAALELILFDRLLRRVLQGMSIVGVIASLYFTFLQIFFIGAFCIYCVASAIIALLILVFASRIEPLRKVALQQPPAPHLRMPPTA